MKVLHNGFTGRLDRLELVAGDYDLDIYDGEKDVTHKFEGVKLEDVKFLGGEVSFT